MIGNKKRGSHVKVQLPHLLGLLHENKKYRKNRKKYIIGSVGKWETYK